MAMKEGLKFGEVDLWKGTPSEAIWRAFRTHLDGRVSAVFGDDRERRIVEVRESRVSAGMDLN